MGRALVDNGAAAAAALGLPATGQRGVQDRRWDGPPFAISGAAGSGAGIACSIEPRTASGVELVAMGCRCMPAVRSGLGAADVDGDLGIRGLAGAEAVFTAVRLRGVNRTNHDESRERRGPALSPRLGALSCRRIEPQPHPWT